MSQSSCPAVLDLVLGNHWVAVYKDGRNRLNVRMVSKEDAWKYDVQKRMEIEIIPKPKNRCKVVKVLLRPV